ncbi:hypothetical protein OGK28_002186 [Staphylococcus pseudintermedius]|nr:hypothetical protein [Staphylococcus pseudintermedius]EGQ2810484.1 hypothetical protein [Staphylococcus pseudintermedius]EGQ3958136.1 hypothetical protein [Staphylococcus pseudintermedius]EGQ4070852.1 hypothetical protein [Staphylococcus pseudintermedius]EHC9966034.1 hypothetical protein [Staphylococcus pseudintermedius]
MFDALSFNESTVDTNVLASSFVVLPLEVASLNEFTADTNSLASVLTASLVDVDALTDSDSEIVFDRLVDFEVDALCDFS